MKNSEIDSVYLNMFLEETKEQIDKMEEDFLLLDEGTFDEQTINRIFRMAHSVKGAAATMGFNNMTQLAHSMENLLDKIRGNNIEVDSSLIDILFNSIDVLKQIHENISNEEDCEVSIEEILFKINSISLASKAGSEKVVKENKKNSNEALQIENYGEVDLVITEEEKKQCQSIDASLNVYKLRVVMKNTTMMKSVKGFLIVNNLLGISDIIKTDPEDFENLSEKEYDGILEAIIATNKDYEYIYDNINSISEIDKIIIKKVREGKKEVKLKKNIKIIDDNCHNKKETTIRIDVKKIDKLLNLVGEFIIDKEALNEISMQMKRKYKNDPLINKLMNLIPHISYISSELQETVMTTRMLPLENIFNRFPRMVRDLAKKCEKKVEFIIEGKETEIDRGIIQELIDPLTHLIRNAVDHGIETIDERKKAGKVESGTIKLSAKHEENNVVIELCDDGKGLDIEKIKSKILEKNLANEEDLSSMKDRDIMNFIFEPGFSTAKELSDISGRGVGLDVVKSNIGNLNGIIDIKSELGKGTSFIIKLPLTLAIIQALLIKENDYTFALPISSIIETLRLKDDEIKDTFHLVKDIEMFKWREQIIPVIRLGKYFDINDNRDNNKLFIIIIGSLEKKAAVVVDELIGEREIVIKSMGDFIGEGKLLGKLNGISGVSILGDGSFAYVMDMASIIRNKSFK